MPDYYEVLQVSSARRGGCHSGRVPDAGAQIPPRPRRRCASNDRPERCLGCARRPGSASGLRRLARWNGRPGRVTRAGAHRAGAGGRGSARPGAQPEAEAPRPTDATHAGPPPGHPSGTVLDFGRYAGWSLGEIARYDVVYLEWLQRATFGRKLRAEIDALLRQRAPAVGRPASGQQWNRRR